MIVGQTARRVNARAAILEHDHERKRTFFEPREPPEPELLPEGEQRAVPDLEPVLEHVVHLDLHHHTTAAISNLGELGQWEGRGRTLRTSSNATEKAENASCTTLSTVSDLTMCWNARSFRSCSSSSAPTTTTTTSRQ